MSQNLIQRNSAEADGFYSYAFFNNNLNIHRTIKEILEVHGDFSSIPLEVVFNKNRSHAETRAFNSLRRGILTGTSSASVVTLEDLLNMQINKFNRIRNLGKESQTEALNALLRYFNKSVILPEVDQRTQQKDELDNYLSDLDKAELKDLIVSLFNEKSLNMQRRFLDSLQS